MTDDPTPDDLTPDDLERAKLIVDWVNRAFDACEQGGTDAIPPLIDELDEHGDLAKNMAMHGLIVDRVNAKQRTAAELARLDRVEADLQQRLDHANHLLATVGMDPQ